MTAPHPKIAWQMNKTPETIAFVKEAAVALHTRNDFRDGERELLAWHVKNLVSGTDSLIVDMTVDEWFNKVRVPKQMRTFGAQPPPDLAWQVGKTVATLDFIREAEQALVGTDLEPNEKYTLEAKIERLKDGSESLEDDETLGSWLERLRDHYP